MGNRAHLSDAELLLIAEGVTDPARRSPAARHLAACERCARRQLELDTAMERLTRRYRAARSEVVASARARARARLDAALTTPGPAPAGWWRLTAGGVAAAVVVVALAAPFIDRPTVGRRDPASPPANAGLWRPLPDLTPGAIRPVRLDEICGEDPFPDGPVVALGVSRLIFEAYGVDFQQASDYELDFLITPELGGAPDVRNLWPQPYRTTIWNAYVKDELERYLHHQVCQGSIDIATAQRELAVDWIEAYKRHFQTDRPRRSYARHGRPRDWYEPSARDRRAEPPSSDEAL